MKAMQRLIFAGWCLVCLGLVPGARAGIDDGSTAFSVQGTLLVPGYGTPPYRYDLTFTLYSTNTGGSPIAGPTTNTAVLINSTNGSFTTFPNFGANLDNSHSYWLEIGVRTNGVNGAFTTLSPRQAITPVPQSYYAANAGMAAVALAATNFVGPVAGDVSGLQGATVVTAVGGQMAANIARATVAANGATSTGTAGTLVARDGSGSFAANSATLAGKLNLPFPAVITSGGTNILMEEGSLYLGFNNSTLSAQASVPDLYNTGFGDWALHNAATLATASGMYNTGVGEYALSNNLSGYFNTAEGFGALLNSTAGNDNTADGYQALNGNTTGTYNSAVGSGALFMNTTGLGNTAVGYGTLYWNANGYRNTAVGLEALSFNTTGSHNEAIGSLALQLNTTGSNNAANGDQALWRNTTGTANTAAGYEAMFLSTTSSNNVAAGANALANMLTGTNNIAVGYQAGVNFSAAESANIDIGNAGVTGENNTIRIGNTNIQNNAYVAGIYGTPPGTGALTVVVDSTGHLGTESFGGGGPADVSATNITLGGLPVCPDQAGVLNLPVTSDAGAMLAGAITLGGCNQLFLHAYGVDDFFGGLGAGNLTLTGTDNTGLGFETLPADTTGSDNTASGAQALYFNTSGHGNEANGKQSLYNNADGYNNTANGYQAMFANTSGYDNAANGWQALYNNTTGWFNTANGIWAMRSNTSGNNDTANGYDALGNNTTGILNTADGVHALLSNATGSNNVAVGADALGNVPAGTNNIAVGCQAGINFSTTESANIDIGNAGVSGDNNTIRIGTDDFVGTNNQTSTYIAGIYDNMAVAGVPVFVQNDGKLGTMTSSARYKQNIQSMAGASEVLLALRPVKYQYKPGIDPQGRQQFGLIAEEVEKVDPDLVVHDQQHGIYTVRYEAVNAMLLNEFLKQHQTLEAQNQEIESLKEKAAQVDSLAGRLEELQKLVKQLAAQK